jgi:hypothetical protein
MLMVCHYLLCIKYFVNRSYLVDPGLLSLPPDPKMVQLVLCIFLLLLHATRCFNSNSCLSTPASHTVLPYFSLASNNILNSFSFSCAFLARLHNASNTSISPLFTAACYTVLPNSSLASNDLLNSFGFSCAYLAQLHNASNISKLPLFTAACNSVPILVFD